MAPKIKKAKRTLHPAMVGHQFKPKGKVGGTSTGTATKTATSTKTSTVANPRGNVTVTGGAGDGHTIVHIGGSGKQMPRIPGMVAKAFGPRGK